MWSICSNTSTKENQIRTPEISWSILKDMNHHRLSIICRQLLGKMFRARFADCVFDETKFPRLGHPEMDADSREEKETISNEVKDMLFKGRPTPLVPDPGPNAARVEELLRQIVNLNKIAVQAGP
jgi:hypothetical protein